MVAATWTLLALLGLEAVFQVFPHAFTAAKLIGAIYLIYIAWSIWRTARDKIEAKDQPVRHVFWQGAMINVLNPKAVLFAAAVLVVVFPSNMALMDNAIVVLNHLAIEVLFYTALAFGMSTDTIKTNYLKAKVYIDRVASIILGGLGLRLLVDR